MRQNNEIHREYSCPHPVRAARIVLGRSVGDLSLGIHRYGFSYTVLPDTRFFRSNGSLHMKKSSDVAAALFRVL